MVRPRHASFDKKKVVAENRRARFDYAIEEVFEAGIALTGTEVKSLRFGEGSIAESYAEVKDGEVWLINANIPEFSHGNRFNHEPKRPRKLLLNDREIDKLYGAVARQGMTLVPLSIYFNSRGRAKVELALARGRKLTTSATMRRRRTGRGSRAACCASMASMVERDRPTGSRANMPKREELAESRWMKPFGSRVLHSEFWRFTRRSVPRGVAVGLFVGVFLLIPGVQIVGAALLSMPFRANIPIAAAMTFLTNPVTTPFLLDLASIKVGNLLGFRADIASF